MNQLKLPPYQKKKGNFQSKSIMALKIQDFPSLPDGFVPLDNQVAGHTFVQGTDAIGLIKNNVDGTLFKPATKPLCGVREIKFYETVEGSSEQDIVPLKELIPEYRGHTKLVIDGKNIELIKLYDLSHGMLEPCIMDVKIGSRTWDPLATTEKQEAEESKYKACKQNLGICIPGFQVYSLSSSKYLRYGKDYGKNLNENTIKEAFRKFLNTDSGLCRILITQFLTDLWSIQKWARSQTTFRLYSSSILLVYDARRLKPILIRQQKSLNNPKSTNSSPKTPSTPDLEAAEHNVEPLQRYHQIQRSHSTTNNYEEDMKTMRQDYVFMLDNLVGSYENKMWSYARMIDFAHAFPAEEKTVDSNYLQGIDSLVKIFEEFLKECE